MQMASVKDSVREDRRKRSLALDILNTEQLIHDFLHKAKPNEEWEIPPITDYSLFEFRKYIQEEKDKLWDRFE